MAVVACVHDLNSKGALNLKDIFSGSNRSHLLELEITEDQSVKNLKEFVENLLQKNKQLGKSRGRIQNEESKYEYSCSTYIQFKN